MGSIILQMMISVDGMVDGPRRGELDWIAKDEPLNQDHKARLEQATAVFSEMDHEHMYPQWQNQFRQSVGVIA